MIVLLTDFGSSEYVGIMKGVVYGIHPDAKIVDLCHSAAPQCVIEAAWILCNGRRYFPAGSVFCCVVDPGVGTDRRAIAAKTADYFFVAPDNGLLWETIKEQENVDVRDIPIPPDASKTFHGRDVFAKAAARIALGKFEEIGEPIPNMTRLVIPLQGRDGTVVRIDHFGNIVTNLPALNKEQYVVRIGRREVTMPFHTTYEQAQPDEPFLITGSCGTLELSIKNGRANSRFALAPGQRIRAF